MLRVLTTILLGLLLRPNHISAQEGQSCSICPEGSVITNGALVLGTASFVAGNATCNDVEARALNGTFSPATCTALRNILATQCGCKEAKTAVPVPSPTKMPIIVPAPTTSPVLPTRKPTKPTKAPVATTGSPTARPTSSPVTKEPSDVPTATPSATIQPSTFPTSTPSVPGEPSDFPSVMPSNIATEHPATSGKSNVLSKRNPNFAIVPVADPLVTLEALLFFQLNGLNASYLPDQSAFVSTCLDLLNQKNDGVSDWSCSVKQSQGLARKLRAILASVALEVEVIIGGKTQSSTSQEAFFNSVLQYLQEKADTFLVTLKSSNPAYELVNLLEVSSSSLATSKTPTIDKKTTENSNEIGAGIVAGIVVGVVLAVLLIGAGVLVLSKSKKHPYPEVPETSKDHRIMINPPPRPTETPEACAIAVGPVESVVPVEKAESVGGSSGVSGSDSLDNHSFHKSGSSTVAGESEMDTFSVAAGNVEGTAAKSAAAADTSASGDELSSHAMSSLRQTMISRTIVAPPGKLGIVIDTTLEGPIVHKINPQSPLEGSLFPGDIIVAIDDVDTRAMSASAITALMVRTANLRRTLTVLSEDVNN